MKGIIQLAFEGLTLKQKAVTATSFVAMLVGYIVLAKWLFWAAKWLISNASF